MEVRCAEAFAEDEVVIGRPDGTSHRLVVGPTLERLLRTSPPNDELSSWQGAFEYAALPWRRPGPYGVHPLTHALGLFDDLGPRSYNACVLPHWTVTAVAHVPGGAHPSYAQGHYKRDNAFYEAWDAIARDRDSFTAWVKENILEKGPDAFARFARK